jgi:hypothetical protein
MLRPKVDGRISRTKHGFVLRLVSAEKAQRWKESASGRNGGKVDAVAGVRGGIMRREGGANGVKNDLDHELFRLALAAAMRLRRWLPT